MPGAASVAPQPKRSSRLLVVFCRASRVLVSGDGEWRWTPRVTPLGPHPIPLPSPPAARPRPDPAPGGREREGRGLRQLSRWARRACEEAWTEGSYMADEADLGKCPAGEVAGSPALRHPDDFTPGALVASPCPRGTVHRCVCEHLLCAAHSADALGDEGEDWCMILALDSVQGNC